MMMGVVLGMVMGMVMGMVVGMMMGMVMGICELTGLMGYDLASPSQFHSVQL